MMGHGEEGNIWRGAALAETGGGRGGGMTGAESSLCCSSGKALLSFDLQLELSVVPRQIKQLTQQLLAVA